jgi:uncharacterized protein
MIDYQSINDKYYPSENELRRILLTHSRSVAAKAMRIADLHPELRLDKEFVQEAAMLHDIGIFRCDAPGIQCFGTEPYICHGIIGAQILRDEGYERHARVCERHTGTGITVEEIDAQQLPLPRRDYQPENLEEKVICYADKFFSKTHLERERTVLETAQSLEKFGNKGVKRFLEWAKIFE